mmetsp:Transcript_3232/g.6705  ORF Transcript_3232/g.6705 Transcript_3232/m.6705 type:complete len:335 (-) Transcript_3232:44-1048(-)
MTTPTNVINANAGDEHPPADGKKRRIENETATASASQDDVAPEPITAEGKMPKKRFYRQRAHCNPLSHNDAFSYPRDGPGAMDWTAEHYPSLAALRGVDAGSVTPTVLDVGCGFGGLTVALSALLPDETILGMEIRAKVTEYVRLRISALRSDPSSSAGEYQNASVMRTNSMKYLPFLFSRASVKKIFFCFPDPHFKRKNHPRRIVATRLLTEYAHVLPTGGRLYAITDVRVLHEWHVAHCDAHPSFERIGEGDLAEDPCVAAMVDSTEEGKKVARGGHPKYYCVYRRISTEESLRRGDATAESFWNSDTFALGSVGNKDEAEDVEADRNNKKE